MKTTIEIPDALFRRSKASAALRGESLQEFVAAALSERLEREFCQASAAPRGWRTVFGGASVEQVTEVDAVVAEEFERVAE